MMSPLAVMMVSTASFGVLSSMRMVTVPPVVATASLMTMFIFACRARVRRTRPISSP